MNKSFLKKIDDLDEIALENEAIKRLVADNEQGNSERYALDDLGIDLSTMQEENDGWI